MFCCCKKFSQLKTLNAIFPTYISLTALNKVCNPLSKQSASWPRYSHVVSIEDPAGKVGGVSLLDGQGGGQVGVELGLFSLSVPRVPGLAHQEDEQSGDPASHDRGREVVTVRETPADWR